MPDPDVGQIWRDRKSGRLVKILEREVHGTGPAWTYCDEQGRPEPHGLEPANGCRYDTWFWHYCDVLSFVMFNSYEFVRDA